MIISDLYKYVFFECPLTASWSIRRELIDYYGGQTILHKHASYPEFRKIATDEQLHYYFFAGIRNPLDVLVSRYYKLKYNFKNHFCSVEAIEKLLIDYSDLKKYHYIVEHDISFEDYFNIFCVRFYSDMIDTCDGHLDFIIHYESLQDDFSKILERIGLEQIRPIPKTNITPGRETDWKLYYSPNIIEKAKRICGPFMEKWGYRFPADWRDYDVSRINRFEYRMMVFLRSFYLIHFRYSNRMYAKLIRQLRARLFT